MSGETSTTGDTAAPRERPTPGGRGAKVVAAVHAATLALLEERGYDGMEIPEVAERAGVNKTSVYRRWPGKAELVLDVALARMRADVPTPDTGSLTGDLASLLRSVADVLNSPFAGGLLRVLMSRGANDPVIRQQISAFWEERFAVSGQLVERAVRRRELPVGTNPRKLLEFASSPLYFRSLVVGVRVSDADIEEIVSRVIRAFSAG